MTISESSETHEVEAAALALLDIDGKMEAVRRLAAAKKRRNQLQAQLEEAEREYGAEHTAAVRAGWADGQLTRLGFEEPTRRPKGRPRGQSPRAPKNAERSAATPPTAAPDPASPAALDGTSSPAPAPAAGPADGIQEH